MSIFTKIAARTADSGVPIKNVTLKTGSAIKAKAHDTRVKVAQERQALSDNREVKAQAKAAKVKMRETLSVLAANASETMKNLAASVDPTPEDAA